MDMAEWQRVHNAHQAKEFEKFRDALVELLYQLADDDFILSYRGSEWLGLAPHIEEDVSFSSISQDTMGHAVAFYEMLESLGEGKADDLAQLRQPEAFRNAILVERPNGTGHYMESPQYDWAYTVIRFYLYELFKQVRLESLVHSTYVPLAQLVHKMMPELHYHLLHWSVWLKQLSNSTDEAKSKMVNALQKVWVDLGDLFDLGPQADAIVQHGLIEGEELLKERWMNRVKQALEVNGLPWLGKPVKAEWSGRAGQHTDDLKTALQTLSEVYRLDPEASW
jgi:ring-1,2-phenylacetyl-CoA epoxidase subunit PaaC